MRPQSPYLLVLFKNDVEFRNRLFTTVDFFNETDENNDITDDTVERVTAVVGSVKTTVGSREQKDHYRTHARLLKWAEQLLVDLQKCGQWVGNVRTRWQTRAGAKPSLLIPAAAYTKVREWWAMADAGPSSRHRSVPVLRAWIANAAVYYFGPVE